VADNFAPVFAGWNVWDVWQVDDLGDLNPMNLGLSHERRLRIWVEDELRLHAAGAIVADPADLKGEQVEVLSGQVEGLRVAKRREELPGELPLLEDKATLWTVRFFNRGAPSRLAWPFDDEYMLDEILVPDDSNPATSGPAPKLMLSELGDVAGDVAGTAAKAALGIGAIVLLVLGLYAVYNKGK